MMTVTAAAVCPAHELLAWRPGHAHQGQVKVKDPHSRINHRNKAVLPPDRGTSPKRTL